MDLLGYAISMQPRAYDWNVLTQFIIREDTIFNASSD
jgi:hypothetical protein